MRLLAERVVVLLDLRRNRPQSPLGWLKRILAFALIFATGSFLAIALSYIMCFGFGLCAGGNPNPVFP